MGREIREYLQAYWTAARAAYSQANAVWHLLATLLPAAGLVGLSQIAPLPWWAAVIWVAFYITVSVPYQMWREQKKLTLPHGPTPDLPIRELFDLVGSGIGDIRDPHTEGWRHIGMEILDKLSTGQLVGWGRSHEGRIVPLAEIRRDYWRSAQWSYYFLADEKDEMYHQEHVWPIFNTLDQGERYFDVYVNRAQALRIWGKNVQTKSL
jgi:hypothetical protein